MTNVQQSELTTIYVVMVPRSIGHDWHKDYVNRLRVVRGLIKSKKVLPLIGVQ